MLDTIYVSFYEGPLNHLQKNRKEKESGLYLIVQ